MPRVATMSPKKECGRATRHVTAPIRLIDILMLPPEFTLPPRSRDNIRRHDYATRLSRRRRRPLPPRRLFDAIDIDVCRHAMSMRLIFSLSMPCLRLDC